MQRLLPILKKIPFQHLKIVRFGISGGTSVALNFGILWLLTEFFHVWYLLSSGIAIAIGFVCSFLLQKFWTFENHSLDRVYVQFPQYIALGITNIALNSLLLFGFVEYLHLWYIAGQVVCTLLLATMNFFVYRHFIFVHHTTNAE